MIQFDMNYTERGIPASVDDLIAQLGGFRPGDETTGLLETRRAAADVFSREILGALESTGQTTEGQLELREKGSREPSLVLEFGCGADGKLMITEMSVPGVGSVDLRRPEAYFGELPTELMAEWADEISCGKTVLMVHR